MSYFPPKSCVDSPSDCSCGFLRVWGGPYESFWHNGVPVMLASTGTGVPQLATMRLRQKLKSGTGKL